MQLIARECYRPSGQQPGSDLSFLYGDLFECNHLQLLDWIDRKQQDTGLRPNLVTDDHPTILSIAFEDEDGRVMYRLYVECNEVDQRELIGIIQNHLAFATVAAEERR